MNNRFNELPQGQAIVQMQAGEQDRLCCSSCGEERFIQTFRLYQIHSTILGSGPQIGIEPIYLCMVCIKMLNPSKPMLKKDFKDYNAES